VPAIVPFKMAYSSAPQTLPAPLTALPRAQTSSAHPWPGSNPLLHSYFNALYASHGPQHWWPGRSRFEIIVGAILTQNTSWKNVERAMVNLRKAKLLSPAAIRAVSPSTLAEHLRPSGYFRQKTKTLKSFVAFLFKRHEGSLGRLFATPSAALRQQLLALHGIGPETADSILLYAGKHPIFVVDAYARRILERHALIPREAQVNSRRSYEQVRSLFESQLPRDSQLFNEFHALIVYTGKHFCSKTNPSCTNCALSPFLPAAVRPGTGQDPLKTGPPITRHASVVPLP